ncbi:MAG: transglutaminase family protein [Nitrospinaceae bacterium]|jgi:regulator of sirC expression with transglutaminase-like and TPR domain|nr:MAG: transglutaminase family protein [Nitrospinaceae bacterium]
MSKDPAKSQISHLIQLLDDRDAFVRARVRDELLRLGEDALPFLEMAARGDNSTLRPYAREVIEALLPLRLAEKFRRLSPLGSRRDLDLETGALLLMEFGHPGADARETVRRLDVLAEELAKLLNENDAPATTVEMLSRFLFVDKGFRGNQENFFDPDNSYLNRVLETRMGIPITLSAVCLFVGWRLGLPLEGVGLPGHFIVKYKVPGNDLFFDPFSGGRPLDRDQCAQIVESFGNSFEEIHLAAATHRETLIRMMNNLIMIYRNNHQQPKADQLGDYVRILLGSPGRHGKPA